VGQYIIHEIEKDNLSSVDPVIQLVFDELKEHINEEFFIQSVISFNTRTVKLATWYVVYWSISTSKALYERKGLLLKMNMKYFTYWFPG